MQVVFDAPLFVHYGFAYFSAIVGDEPSDDLDVAFRGQQNGICGAAVPHRLTLMIGTHTGDVPLRVEWHDAAPALDEQWQDVVEVPFDPQTQAAQVSAFQDYLDVTLPAVGSHRARFCAIGMDAAQEPVEQEPGEDNPPPPDRYLLQLWPAPMTSDEIVRIGTEHAQYWHDEFGGTAPLVAGELNAIRAAENAAADELVEEGDSFFTLNAEADLDVIGDLLAIDSVRQRATARWLARKTVEMAGLAADPAFAAALEALDAGRPLPAPFDDFAAAAALALNSGHATEETLVDTVNDPEPDDDFGWYGDDALDEGPDDRRHLTLHAVIALDAAVGSDPARAVVLAYRSAFAADDTGDRLDRELVERLSPSTEH